MIEKAAPLAHGEIDVLILQALVRKLHRKGRALAGRRASACCSMPLRVWTSLAAI